MTLKAARKAARKRLAAHPDLSIMYIVNDESCQGYDRKNAYYPADDDDLDTFFFGIQPAEEHHAR